MIVGRVAWWIAGRITRRVGWWAALWIAGRFARRASLWISGRSIRVTLRIFVQYRLPAARDDPVVQHRSGEQDGYEARYGYDERDE